MVKLMSLFLASLTLAACQSQGAANAPAMAASAAVAASTPAAPLDQPAQITPPRSASEMHSVQLGDILAGPWRSAAHKARDRYRHPRATLAFFGVQPDMTVIEITPGGGWYTEILAPIFNENGHYVAAIADSAKPGDEPAHAAQVVHGLIKAWPQRFANAQVLRFDPHAPAFGAPGQADAVLTFRNVHNWVAGGYADTMFQAFFAALKPGGVLGVTDHRAAPGESLAQVKGSGYLPQNYVVKLATDAGFKRAASSEINANPNDNRHHPKGVWTLPPTLALGAQDKAKYLAIGESDRMTLRFVKPPPDEITVVGMEGAPANAASAH